MIIYVINNEYSEVDENYLILSENGLDQKSCGCKDKSMREAAAAYFTTIMMIVT